MREGRRDVSRGDLVAGGAAEPPAHRSTGPRAIGSCGPDREPDRAAPRRVRLAVLRGRVRPRRPRAASPSRRSTRAGASWRGRRSSPSSSTATGRAGASSARTPSVPAAAEGVGDLERAERARVLRPNPSAEGYAELLRISAKAIRFRRPRGHDPDRRCARRPPQAWLDRRELSSSRGCTGPGPEPISTPSRSTPTRPELAGSGASSPTCEGSSMGGATPTRRSGSPSWVGARPERRWEVRRNDRRPGRDAPRGFRTPRGQAEGVERRAGACGTRGAIPRPASRRARGVAPPGSSTRRATPGPRGRHSPS